MARTKIKFKSGQIKEVVLAAIGISLVLGGSIFITPNFPIVLSGLIKIAQELKNIRIPKFKIKRVLKNLEKRKIISLDREGEEVIVKVLDSKNVEILKYSIKKLLELKAKKKVWNSKWFLVAFDVPEGERNKRNYLRKFLRDIGFYQYQKSIYVYPYECEEEVGLIKKIVEGGEYINYIIAERLEKETELKIFFQLA